MRCFHRGTNAHTAWVHGAMVSLVCFISARFSRNTRTLHDLILMNIEVGHGQFPHHVLCVCAFSQECSLVFEENDSDDDCFSSSRRCSKKLCFFAALCLRTQYCCLYSPFVDRSFPHHLYVPPPTRALVGKVLCNQAESINIENGTSTVHGDCPLPATRRRPRPLARDLVF